MQENQDRNAGTNIVCLRHQTARRYLKSKNWFLPYVKTAPKIKSLYINFFYCHTSRWGRWNWAGHRSWNYINDVNSYPTKLENHLQKAQNDCAGIFFGFIFNVLSWFLTWFYMGLFGKRNFGKHRLLLISR